jgi:hypothetical protein
MEIKIQKNKQYIEFYYQNMLRNRKFAYIDLEKQEFYIVHIKFLHEQYLKFSLKDIHKLKVTAVTNPLKAGYVRYAVKIYTSDVDYIVARVCPTPNEAKKILKVIEKYINYQKNNEA